MFEKLKAWFVAKNIEKAIGLTEDSAMETKKWWKSKGVWTGIVTVLVGGYEATRSQLAPQFGYSLPEIPSFLYMVLGSLGVYSRVTAAKTITK